MNLTPAQDALELQKKIDAIELCGKNRGPHDYMPIEWKKNEFSEYVTRLMCRICFCNVATSQLIEHYPEVKF